MKCNVFFLCVEPFLVCQLTLQNAFVYYSKSKVFSEIENEKALIIFTHVINQKIQSLTKS